MKMERRRFLQQLAGACAAGVSRNLGIGTATAVAAGGAAAAVTTGTAAVAATAAVGLSGVRMQVFEVVVRQAVLGVPWKEMCAGPMSVNGITVEEVEQELKRRQALGHIDGPGCACAQCVAKRLNLSQELFRAKKAAEEGIPHSPQSPCACKDCLAQATKMRDDAVSQALKRTRK